MEPGETVRNLDWCPSDESVMCLRFNCPFDKEPFPFQPFTPLIQKLHTYMKLRWLAVDPFNQNGTWYGRRIQKLVAEHYEHEIVGLLRQPTFYYWRLRVVRRKRRKLQIECVVKLDVKCTRGSNRSVPNSRGFHPHMR